MSRSDGTQRGSGTGVATISPGPPALIVGVQSVRRQAVAFFLGDTSFLADGRFRALARRLPDRDDFNSAVGAWFIALAAARRNGKPELDVEDETGSRYLDDLRAVGLLIESGFRPEPFREWAAMSPQQAVAGRARAKSGVRDDAGRWVSSDTSEPSALDTVDQRIQPSPPLPSNQLSTERGVQGGEDSPIGRVLDAYIMVRHRGPTPGQRRFLDAYLDTFDATGPERAERIILEHYDDPIGALMADLKAFRAERANGAAKAEEAAAVRPRRGPSTLERIKAERDAILLAESLRGTA